MISPLCQTRDCAKFNQAGYLLALFRRLDIQHLQRQRRRSQSGDFRLIVCRSHFHYIHPNDVEIFQAAYQFNGAIRGQAANYRRTGSRRESRIQAVDIKVR